MRLFLKFFKHCEPLKAKEVLHRYIGRDLSTTLLLGSLWILTPTQIPLNLDTWVDPCAAAVVTIFMGFCHCHSKQAHLWHAIPQTSAFCGDRKLHLLVQNAIVWNKTLGVVRETNCDLEQISLFPTRNTLVCLLVHSNEVSCQLLASPSSTPKRFWYLWFDTLIIFLFFQSRFKFKVKLVISFTGFSANFTECLLWKNIWDLKTRFYNI